MRPRRILTPWTVAILLVLAILAAFAPLGGNGFIGNFDDDEYLVANPVIRRGLTPTGIWWAFSTFHAANWHPLTWISHMTDVSLFGLDPGRHHLVSLLLHAAAAVGLLLLLRGWTGSLLHPAWVAALFALHPQRVESVAWVAERKDVLSGMLAIFTLLAYTRHARRPSPGRLAVALALYALSLLAKPMPVSIPLVLLLVDVWPLGRWPRSPAPSRPVVVPLAAEKVPFLLLALASAAATWKAQSTRNAMALMEHVPLPWRLGNAAVSLCRYLEDLVWPRDLSVFYPHPGRSLPTVAALTAAAGVIAVSVAVTIQRRRRPSLLTGWFWFLATLLPVLGLVQVGSQGMADRYTYLATTGVALAAAGLLLPGGKDLGRRLLPPLLLAPLLLAPLARRQAALWRDGVTLFRHALAVGGDSVTVRNTLGNALMEKGQHEAALPHFITALRLSSRDPRLWNNLGFVLTGLGRLEEARGHYAQALALDPDFAMAHNNLGLTLARMGRDGEAGVHFREAIRLKPDYPEALLNLGTSLFRGGSPEEAMDLTRRALALDPGFPMAHNNLGVYLLRSGRREEALAHFREALLLDPTLSDARRNLVDLGEAP
jgi:Flp pilus assembly protein TadD